MDSKWPKMTLVSAVTSVWLLHAAEAPRLALAIVQYSLLTCALVGSAVMYATDR